MNSSRSRMSPSSLEPLENRIAPALLSIITATYAKGVLTLTGDDQPSEFAIALTGIDAITLSASLHTQIALNGAAPADSVVLTGPITSLTANLGVGDDHLTLTGLSVTGALSFDGGDGMDRLDISNCVVGGAGTLKGGNDNDAISLLTLEVGGALSIDLGEGDNQFTYGGGALNVKGVTTLAGGAGVDAIDISGNTTFFAKGLTVSLGAGDNTFHLENGESVFGGPLAITNGDHTGVAKVTLDVGSLQIKGGLTVAYGTGPSTTSLASDNLQISGAVKVMASEGTDFFGLTVDGAATVKGGFKIDLGGGANTNVFQGSALVAPSLAITGGDGTDNVIFGTNSFRLGTVTLALGGGGNSANIGAAAFKASGLFKYTGGAGNDLLAFSGQEVVLAKGVQMLGGDGANTFSEDVISFRGGALGFTGGTDTDVLTFHSAEAVLGGIKAVLGAGNNTVDAEGGFLAVGGAVSFTAADGDDSLIFGTAHQRFAKSLTFALGEGLANVSLIGTLNTSETLRTFQAGGPITVTAGSHATGQSSFILAATNSVNVSGPVTATFGDGDTQLIVAATSPGKIASVKFVTGAGNDAAIVSGQNAGVNIGAVSFNGGDGVNSLDIFTAHARIGLVTYLGGAGQDVLGAHASAHSLIAGVNANFGSGTYLLDLSGDLSGRLGAVTAQAANGPVENGAVTLQKTTYLGAVKINTGEGSDSVTVADSVFAGPFALGTSGGPDVVNIESGSALIATTFRGAVQIATGAGTDTVNIGSNTPASHAEFKSTVKIDGGDGVDVAHLSAVLFGNVYPAGQPVLSGVETND